MEEGYNICIICSLKAKEACMNLVDHFETIGLSVHHPFKHQSGGLYTIQKLYLEAIDKSDLIVAISKEVSINQLYNDSTHIIERFGESVSYELAYASHIGKPIVVWGAFA